MTPGTAAEASGRRQDVSSLVPDVPTGGGPAPPARWRELMLRVATLAGALVVVAAVTAAIHLTRLEVPPIQVPARGAVPATAVAVTEAPQGGSERVASSIDRVDPAWTERIAAATGIPARALVAYGSADLTVDAEQPGCGLGWNTLAAIGAIESGHGTHADAVLGSDGHSTPAVLGPVLDGGQFAAVPDTDGGAWDGDATWDRAVGPMQFIPSTWARWGADGDGDGVADPNQIDDAVLAAARYLCASGSVSSVDGWRTAVFSYNHSTDYVDQVAALANQYARAAGAAS